jgi:hypothetical protein
LDISTSQIQEPAFTDGWQYQRYDYSTRTLRKHIMLAYGISKPSTTSISIRENEVGKMKRPETWWLKSSVIC